MKILLIFILFLAIFIGIIALGLKYFKWLLKKRQEEKKPNETNKLDNKKDS